MQYRVQDCRGAEAIEAMVTAATPEKAALQVTGEVLTRGTRNTRQQLVRAKVYWTDLGGDINLVRLYGIGSAMPVGGK